MEEEIKLEQAASELSEKKWYQDVSLEDVETFILANMKTAVRSVIAIGYYLKCIRDGKLFLEAGYGNIWDYAQDKYGFSRSTASRYMARNDKFSVDGNSPVLADKYREFSKAQLQEMLSLDDGFLEQVTPDMTVRQIREIKRQQERPVPYYEIPGQISISNFPGIAGAEEERVGKELSAVQQKESYTVTAEDLLPAEPDQEPVATSQQAESDPAEKNTGKCLHRPESATELQQDGLENCKKRSGELSAYGTEKRVYPPGSLLTTKGCEGGHDCFSCAMECQIRQKERYCVEAPMGNPFSCEILSCSLDTIREEVGEKCQFIDHDLAEHYTGSGEANPCCKNCLNPCGYICGRAMKALQKEQRNDENCCENAAEKTEKDMAAGEERLYPVREALRKESAELNDWMKAFEGEPADRIPSAIEHKKIVVAALAGMVTELEGMTGAEQPELPEMKNNDQRKEWLRKYQNWGLWYTDQNISVRYYKYDFDNGARLIVEEYDEHSPYAGDYTASFYHLVGGPEPPKHPAYGFGKWAWHETYCHHSDSETELVEFLKEVQRKK